MKGNKHLQEGQWLREVSIRCRSRRGSSAVFLCVILSALVSISFAFIYSAIAYSTASRADAVMNLAGDSLLSEFDRDLQEEYGLFLLRMTDAQMSSKLREYLRYTFDAEENVSVTSVKASGGAFTVTDPAPVREQILDYMKEGGGLRLRKNADGAGETGDDSGTKPRIAESDAGRALRHGPTIASLPSRQLPKQDLLTRAARAGESLKDPASFFSDGNDRYLLGSYVLGMFNCTTRCNGQDHFFQRETEYVLHGELTDRENRDKTAATLRALRTAPNFAHIYEDPQKREAIAAAAEVLLPGPGGVALQAAIATAWAYAESVNDARLLMKGYRVPLRKDASSWALKLDNVIGELLQSAEFEQRDPIRTGGNDHAETGSGGRSAEELKEALAGDGEKRESAGATGKVIHPKENKGLTYEQYLRILLALADEDLVTARVMDLIQINMRKNVDGGFLIGACASGITIGAEVNGRDYRYEKLYQRLLYR